MGVSNSAFGRTKDTPFFRLIFWRFFTSVKLTLVLIIVIVLLSLISTFLIQTPSGIDQGSKPIYTAWLEGVVRQDFSILTDTLSFFGLFDVFHSFLFLDAGIGVVNTRVIGIGSTGERGFPYTTYQTLMDNLPKARFEDATDIDEARRIKSAAEIKCLEIGCDAADAGVRAVVATARSGVRDYEVMAKLVETLMLHGCEPDTLFLYGSGKDYADSGNGPCRNPRYLRTLENGDMIHTEFNAKYNNYTAQYNQPFSLGEPDKEWQKVFEVAEAALDNAMATLKPGITLQELTRSFHTPIDEAGLKSIRPVFHGLGLTSEEPLASTAPGTSCIPSDSFPVKAGMVFEFEPHVITPDMKKGLTLGYPVLVTDEGCRSLSKSKPEVKIIRN